MCWSGSSSGDVSMPIIDPNAKKWELDLAERVGRAVAARRKDLGMTAMDVAAKTADLGYPITRQAVAKIENNSRAGKVDLAELIVPAAALDLSPLQLVFPDLVDGPVEILPGREATSLRAADWFAGNAFLLESNHSEYMHKVGYLAGIEPLRQAVDVGRARDFVVSLLAHSRQFGMGPGTPQFQDAMTELQRKKADARRTGLVVKDEHDA